MLPMLKARYRAKAKSWAVGEASTGTPQVGIEFVIEEGDHRGEWISGYFFLTDAACDRTLETLRLCGWTGTDVSEEMFGLDANIVELVVEPEDGLPDPHSGEVKQRLRLKFVNKAGGVAMKSALTSDKAKVLAAKMKARLAIIDAKAKREGNGVAAIPPPYRNDGPPPGHPAADDIPF